MKTKYMVIGTFLVMILSISCFSPWKGDEGNLTIVWGKSTGARWFWDEEDLKYFDYIVTLTGPGEKQEHTFMMGVPSATFTVTPGAWTVIIKGGVLETSPTFGSGGSNIHIHVMGISQVEVMPGKNAPKVIPMYSATTVNSWADLNNSINGTNQDYFNILANENRSREELFIIGKSFDSCEEDYYYDDNSNTTSFDFGSKIYIKRPIILIAEDNVTIGRTVDLAGTYFPSFFYVQDGGSLTLGLPGMTGTLTFDNQGEESSSLMRVGIGCTLVMNRGVTIKNGYFVEGGGGVEIANGNPGNEYPVPGGTFIMNGGTITDNRTLLEETFPTGHGDPIMTYVPGGGVVVYKGYVEAGKTSPAGRLIRNGGVISGNKPEDIYYWGEED